MIMYFCVHAYMYVSHRGVFRTIKSLVQALGTGSLMTEPTINSTLLTFIEQVNLYDLQKMVLQFAIHFVPTLGFKGMYDIIHDVIVDITDDVIKIKY